MAIGDTNIDLNNLAGEIAGISSTIQGAAEEVNEALLVLKEKESYYKYLKSKKWKQYMTGEIPVEGVKSVSAAVVNGVIDSDEELYAVQKEIDELKHVANVHNSYLNSLEVKKNALSTTVKIAMAGWYSEIPPVSLEEVSSFIDGSGNIVDPLADRKALRERRRRVTEEEELL